MRFLNMSETHDVPDICLEDLSTIHVNANRLEDVPDNHLSILYKDIPPYRSCKYLYYPIFTILVSVAELILLIWTISIGGIESTDKNPMVGPSALTLLYAGGKWTPYILGRGEWWRLIVAMFLHAGIVHYILNLLTQIVLCTLLEIRYGSIIVAIVYILSGISGNVWSAIFTPGLISVGASGSLFGITGMFLVEFIKRFNTIAHPIKTLIFYLIIIISSFGLGLLPYIDNYAHLGGFIIGIELGMIFVPGIISEKRYKRWLHITIYVLGCILFICTFTGMFLVLYLVKVDVSVWCGWCKYFNCIPRIVDGIDWCRGF